MRHIYDSPLTTELLATWAGEIPLCVSSFFFWRSGTPEQRSQAGLLRALLFDVLSQQPRLISQIFPWHWAKAYSRAVSYSDRRIDYSWPLPTLMKAFGALVQQTTIPLRVCLFIDGLDEFDQLGCSHETIATLLRDVTKSGDIKVCLSSRPLVVFSNVFERFPSLRLQDLTRNDINHFVTDKLHKNARFKNLALKETNPTSNLISEIIEKADGVFLWVSIVVKSLLEGLQYRDSISDLQKRLRLLPSDLEALYRYMFEQIDPVYKESAAEIFQIVRASREHRVWIGRVDEAGPPLTNIALSLATDRDIKPEDLGHFLEKDIRAMSEDMEIRVRVRCAGLLECSGSHGPEDPWSRVNYLHATARDFIEENADIWDEICIRTKDSGFNPHASMFKACVSVLVLGLKFGAQFQTEVSILRGSLVKSAMIYAFYANHATNRLDLSLIQHLQIICFPMDAISSQVALTHSVIEDTRDELNGIPPFVHLAVLYGLFTYVKYFIGLKTKRTKDEFTHLLRRALSPLPGVDRYPCSTKLVSILLKHGANPNNRFHRMSSPWESALGFVWQRNGSEALDRDFFAKERLAALQQLVVSGANPNSWVLVGSGWKSALEIITVTFQDSFPPETARLVQLLEDRGASRKNLSKAQRLAKRLKMILTGTKIYSTEFTKLPLASDVDISIRAEFSGVSDG
jgi:hypothetical protein